MQIIGMLEPGVDKGKQPKAVSIKRSAILDMNVDQVRKGWDNAIHGLVGILEILREDCGVLVPGLIPYNTILIPMAAVWAHQKYIKGADIGANRIKLLRWFWCSVFGQRYENAPNSQAEKDFGELIRWMTVGAAPESVTEFKITSLNLRSIRPRQRAVYRGSMALILQNGALDFHKRGHITSQMMADKKNPVDDHHIFPQDYLNKRNVPTNQRDCILNRTYIDRVTNRRLSRKAPSDYFTEIQTKHGKDATYALMRSHLMPTGDDSPILSDKFGAFIEKREKLLLDIISKKTGNS
jgi:hypothetical protein